MKIIKNNELMQVSGWAYVSTVNGEHVPDHSGDIIKIETLSKAAYDFMQRSRVGKADHEGVPAGYIINSIVFDKAMQDALDIDLGKEGWFITYQITDDTVWEQVKSGDFAMFSIAGQGNYKE